MTLPEPLKVEFWSRLTVSPSTLVTLVLTLHTSKVTVISCHLNLGMREGFS